MTVHTTKQNQELEEEGKCSLQFVALRYTGDKSTKQTKDLARDAGFPARIVLQGGQPTKYWDMKTQELVDEEPRHNHYEVEEREPGPWYFALVADWTEDDVGTQNHGSSFTDTLSAIETQPNFEWSMAEEDIAEGLLSRNYLPTNVFYSGYNMDVRDKLFDHIGLEEEGAVRDRDDEEPYRRQLKEIVGDDIDDEDEQEMTRNEKDVERYLNNYGYQPLRAAAVELGIEDGRPGKREAAEYLADHDREEVREILEE